MGVKNDGTAPVIANRDIFSDFPVLWAVYPSTCRFGTQQ